ncbi:MAG: hypothetical protein ABI231_05305 [Candidatus Tumulicola sp.]
MTGAPRKRGDERDLKQDGISHGSKSFSNLLEVYPTILSAGAEKPAPRAGLCASAREYSTATTMPNPMDPEFTGQNPIVEAATRIRARRELGSVIDAATGEVTPRRPEDAEESLRLFAEHLGMGCKRLNAILGRRSGVTFVRLERPLRLRLRFAEQRVGLELDDVHQLVRVTGLDLDGEYQFDPAAGVPALINLSKISTEQGYGERLTASSLLKAIAAEAELPQPGHLTGPGPLSF